jgi:F-type H+-transporting ATPase subunit delta
MEAIATTYAKALFSLALQEENDQEVLNQINDIKDVFDQNDGLIKILDSKNLNKDDKKDLINKLFENSLNKNVFNFLKLLIDKNRINKIKEICLEYKKVYLEHYHILEARVYSVNLLDEKKLNDIKAILEERYQSSFIIENCQDANLIAGIKIYINDIVIDGSLDNRLKKLKESIMI